MSSARETETVVAGGNCLCTCVHHVTLINCTRCGVNILKKKKKKKVLSHASSPRFETEVVILHIIYGAQLTQQTGLL